MSRREGREPETRRLPSKPERESRSSKPEREPSPKRPRRDGKPATERTSNNHNSDIVDRTDRDQKHRRRLQDALPLEAPLAPKSNVGTDVANKDLDKKVNRLQDGSKRSSDPTEVHRSRSYLQHNERGSAGQGGRNFVHSATAERGWWKDPKDQSDDRIADKVGSSDMQQRDERTQARVNDSGWNHDGLFELGTEPLPPAKKRPAFREKKMPPDSGPVGVMATESIKPSRLDRSMSGSERREERGGRYPRDLDRPERPFTGDRRPLHREDIQRIGPPSRERFHGGNGFRGREKFSGRHGERNQYNPNGLRVEKWKHDLFDEANKSPSPKNEEDQIAKVEALLAL